MTTKFSKISSNDDFYQIYQKTGKISFWDLQITINLSYSVYAHCTYSTVLYGVQNLLLKAVQRYSWMSDSRALWKQAAVMSKNVPRLLQSLKSSENNNMDHCIGRTYSIYSVNISSILCIPYSDIYYLLGFTVLHVHNKSLTSSHSKFRAKAAQVIFCICRRKKFSCYALYSICVRYMMSGSQGL